MGKIILNNSNNNEFVSSCDNKNADGNSQVNVQGKDEFAGAFPEWDLVPPLQVIKRVRRSL